MVDVNFLEAFSSLFPMAYALPLIPSRVNQSSKMPQLRGGIGAQVIPHLSLFNCEQYALTGRLGSIDHVV